MILDYFSETHIQRFNRVRGVDGTTNVIGEGEERSDTMPMVHSGATDDGVLLIPLFSKCH